MFRVLFEGTEGRKGGVLKKISNLKLNVEFIKINYVKILPRYFDNFSNYNCFVNTLDTQLKQ